MTATAKPSSSFRSPSAKPPCPTQTSPRRPNQYQNPNKFNQSAIINHRGRIQPPVDIEHLLFTMITTEPPSTISNSAPLLRRLTRTLTRACFLLAAAATVSPPDPAKWVRETGGKGFGNNELETYTSRPINSYVEDGHLVITARKEN